MFYEPDSKSLKKKKELRQQPNDSRSIKESDAAKTEVLSVIVEENSNTYSGGEQQGPRLGQSFDSCGEELPWVVEGEAALC